MDPPAAGRRRPRSCPRSRSRRLHDLGVKIFTGYKGTIRGGCPIDRAGVIAEQAFRDITDEKLKELFFFFNPTNLAKRFGEIAAQAELATKGDAVGAKTYWNTFEPSRST